MSQHQLNVARSLDIPARVIAEQIADAHRQTDLTIDLTIIEAGLRLKVLPLRDAIIMGRKLNFGNATRRARRRALFALSPTTVLNIVDIGLFADAVARRPDVAERLRRASRSSKPRKIH